MSKLGAMATQPLAPWIFRKRFAVFSTVYGVSFAAGFAIAGLLGIPTQPLLFSPHQELLAFAATGFVVGGWALRVWAASYIAASIVWTQDVQLAELRVSGPYRFTRNPLYLGNVLQALGLGFLGPWPVMVLLVILMVAYTFILISVEERFLTREIGTQYARYRARVARFVPLPWQHAEQGKQPSSFGDGLRSEALTGSIALAAAIYFTWLVVSRSSG